MSIDNRILKEQQFHDTRILEEDAARRPTDKYYVLMELPRALYTRRVEELGRGHRLLEYGCSDGESSRHWAAQGVSTTGIDISPAAIDVARKRAADAKLEIQYEVMNAEQMTFEDGNFDVVSGTGILHHLDLPVAFAEINRVLNDAGHALFIEPLGHNPLINLYRKLTPGMRSEDEHPLRTQDLHIAAQYFSDVHLQFFNLLTFAAIPLRSTPLFRPALSTLRAIDRMLFTILPFTRRYAWMVLLDCSRPKRQPAHHP
ncbi:MAG: class I SAM-dependent methyltransferase [Bacteroidetes bacterium]|nr:class I SAM-dependent methyltransferase [Bacteroidota bacterium]